jgi:hypothetical protein
MNRKQILEAAAECVDGSREEDYGNPENCFMLIADLWTEYICMKAEIYSEIKVEPRDVADMMMLLKIARNVVGGKTDNYVDIAGYAACAGEIISEEEEEACTN